MTVHCKLVQCVPTHWQAGNIIASVCVSISGTLFIFLPIPSHRYLILLTIVPVIYDSANCVLIRQWQWPPLAFVIGLINQISLLPHSATVIIHRTSFILDYKQTDAAVTDKNHGPRCLNTNRQLFHTSDNEQDMT